MNKLIPIAIMMRLRKAGIDKTPGDVGAVVLSDLLNSVGLSNKYPIDEIIDECDELASENFRPLDELGLSPLYNLMDKNIFEIGTSLFDKEEDSTAKALLNEYNQKKAEADALKEKISTILAEDRYRTQIESIMNDANNIADIIIRYLKREGD